MTNRHTDNKQKFNPKILLDLEKIIDKYNCLEESSIPKIKKEIKIVIKELNKNTELYLFTNKNLLLTAKWLIVNNLDKYFKDITNVKTNGIFIH